jgi:serine/threonine protein kinase
LIPVPPLFKNPNKREFVEILRKDIKAMGLSRYIYSILLGAVNGLDNLHRSGFSHRDIKNDNILITENATVKISDFGISKLTELIAHPATV